MDGGEIMDWSITKEGEKRFFAFSFTVISMVLFGLTAIILYLSTKDLFLLLFFIVMTLILVPLIIIPLFYIQSTSGKWANPTIVRIDDDNGYVMVKEEYPDGYVTENRIYFDSIYKIEIKSNRNAKIYYSRKGVKYFWHIVRWCLAKEDREISFQILNEIMKRVDRNKVEIVDLRKR